LIDVKVESDRLRVRLTGWDSFSFCWRLLWDCEVPISKIVRVYVVAAEPPLNVRAGPGGDRGRPTGTGAKQIVRTHHKLQRAPPSASLPCARASKS
jgi:hypothetical protein